jgi:hypothetical protein
MSKNSTLSEFWVTTISGCAFVIFGIAVPALGFSLPRWGIYASIGLGFLLLLVLDRQA